MSQTTFRRKLFLWKDNSENAIGLRFRTFGQNFNVSSGLSEQQSALPEKQLVRTKTFWDYFSFVYLFSGLDGEFSYFGSELQAGCRSVSRKTNRRKQFCGQENRKKSRHGATFFRPFTRKFRRGCHNFIPNVHWSTSRYYLFCKNLPFDKYLRTWKENCSLRWSFLAVFSKLVCRGEKHILRWSVCF